MYILYCVYCIIYIYIYIYCIVYVLYYIYCIIVSSFSRRLLGIVTKKDMLRHIASLKKKDPKTIRYH